jgi:SAM-dependent methyltransferase
MHENDYGATTARFYDAAYATLPTLGADIGFYRQLARGAGGPALELGCGTGRVLLALVGDGRECTGLDASREMLDVLRRKASGAAVRLEHADMRDFDLGGARFGLVYSAFRAFQHLQSVDDQLRCLACVRRHLVPGGTFAFDVFNPRLERMAADEEDETEDLRFEQNGEQVVRYAHVVRHRATQSMRVTFRYERHRDGARVGNETTSFRMRWFWRYELEHLMARAGFADVRIVGDFDGSPITRDSPSYIVQGRSPTERGRS